MKKAGLIFGIIVSGILSGCNLANDLEEFFESIEPSVQEALREANYKWPNGGYGSFENAPFKIDSATHLGNDRLTLWTSYDFSKWDQAKSGEISVSYWDFYENYLSADMKEYSTEYLPDTVINDLGQTFLRFPLEITGLKSETDYRFCINLNLINDFETYTFEGTCETFQTSK